MWNLGCVIGQWFPWEGRCGLPWSLGLAVRKGGATVSRHQAWSAETVALTLRSLPPSERLILPALQRVQQIFGWIPDEAVDLIAAELNVSRAEVVGVLTYYHDLRQSPPPDVHVQVCVAEACQSVGSRELVASLEAAYGVPLGSRVDDVEFSAVYCLGNCALGPAAMVEGRLVGRCDVDRIREAVARAQEVRA
jgi:formate dehydrogenase subunit gamma